MKLKTPPASTGTLEEVKADPDLVAPPAYVGGYQLGGPFGMRVGLDRKPSVWHRFWMRACLGWVWVDA